MCLYIAAPVQGLGGVPGAVPAVPGASPPPDEGSRHQHPPGIHTARQTLQGWYCVSLV